MLFASLIDGLCGLFYRVIAAIIKRMATHNPPKCHKKSAKHTMVFDSVNGILGTGRRKAASWGKQRGDQELICPDQGKYKTGADFVQKIFHESALSCIRSSLFATFAQAVQP